MRIMIVFAAVLASLLPAFGAEIQYTAKLKRVIDGDSISVIIAKWPAEINPIEVRIFGIDAPESGGRAKCEKERALARAAKRMVIGMLPRQGDITVIWQTGDRDKYGRLLARVIDAQGHDVGQALLEAGLAYAYYGGKKQSWCNAV
jgi:micrococcal nuclease